VAAFRACPAIISPKTKNSLPALILPSSCASAPSGSAGIPLARDLPLRLNGKPGPSYRCLRWTFGYPSWTMLGVSKVTMVLALTALLGEALGATAGAQIESRDYPPGDTRRDNVLTGNNLGDAVCPVVYQLDDAPGSHGYHYIFYGNAFFINREGYLLTAAHVVSDFGNGGQLSILVRSGVAPPRLVKVRIIAIDIDHDVAVLRAMPNPFNGAFAVAALSLAGDKPVPGELIGTTALRPSHMKDPRTFELPIADFYRATVLSYRSMALGAESKGTAVSAGLGNPQILTDIFLFSHEVQRGQSGAPVTDVQTGQVVGFIEGRWLHPASSAMTQADKVPSNAGYVALTQGAAVPISYALNLLRERHIVWSTQ
jgi:hypothetical protein